jgi:iron complex outermembrane receptor protein
MKITKKRARIALFCSAASLIAATPALAQEATPAGTETPADEDAFSADGDIVVTAQRREERLVDVPISVSAVSEAMIERAGVTSVANIGSLVPNIQINQTVGNTFGPLISIRGLAPSADTSLGRDQPVGLYIDGVPIAKSTGAAFDTVDLERVEVLRGPQGTLYGKNTIGGAINLIPQRPTGEFGGKITAGYGSFGRITRSLSVNLPETAGFKVKLAYSGRSLDGYYENYARPGNLGEEEMNAARVDILWESGGFTAAYSYDLTDSTGTPAILAPYALGAVASLNPMIAPYLTTERPRGISALSAIDSDFHVTGHALRLEYEVSPAVTLKSITARRTMQTHSASDFDGTPVDILRIILDNDYKQFSQEFQLIGSGSRLDYTFGLFYMRDEYDVYNPRWNVQFGRNFYDLSARGGRTTSIAGYGQLKWKPPILEDKFEVAVGARWTRDTRYARNLLISNSAYAANPAAAGAGVYQRNANGTPVTRSGGPALGARPGGTGIGPSDLIPLENEGDWSQFNPELNLLYKLGDNWNVYGRVATGFKSGGYNDTAATNAAFNVPYEPEKLLSFELGTKGQFFDNHLNLSLAVYHSIYKDFQAGVFVPELVTTNIINAGEAKFTGIELEGTLRPFDNLSLNFGYGYVDARYTDFVLPTGVDVTDTYKIPLVPEHNFLIGATHRADLGGTTLETNLNYSWRDSQWGGITPDPLPSRKAYGLLDGRIALTEIKVGGGAELEFALWGKNLTDTKYWTSAINLSILTVRQWGDPRSGGFEAKVRF